MNKTKIDKAYDHIANKHPDITNKRHLELLTRIYIMRQKKIESGFFFLGGVFLTLFASYISPLLENISLYIDLLVSLLNLSGPVLVIVGVCKFAKAMHEPRTPNEAKELASYDSIEKGGKTDVDLSEYDNTAVIRYEQEKYNEASPFQKLVILTKRIPTLVLLIIVGLTVGGIISAILGAHNILTYEERNKNAVSIQAIVVDIKESYDADEKETEYRYKYEYTYDGKTYTTIDTSHSERELGSFKTILIDSTNPEKIIYNNGKSAMITGVILVLVGIIIFAYSLNKVRDLETPFSVLCLLWMPFAAAAIAFACWGIAMLVNGEWLGLLIIFLGCPTWLAGMFMFRMVFNPK